VDTLKQQLAELEAQKAHLFEQHPPDQEQISKLNEQINELQAQIDFMQSQQQVETAVQTAQEQVTQSFDAITVGEQTLTLGALAANEVARQILYTYFTQYVTSMTEASAKEIAAIKASYESQLKSRNEAEGNLNLQIAQLQQRNNDLTNTLNTTEAELADRESKLKNAADEIDRLNSQVNDLRTEIAVGARSAVSVVDTNLSADLGKMMQDYKNSLPAITNVTPLDNKKSRYSAILATTGDPIEFGYLELGKYREVSATEAEQEAARFRDEQAAGQVAASSEPVQADHIPDPTLDVISPPPVSFPEVPATQPTLEGQSTNGEVAQETVEQRIAALELAVFGKAKGEAA